MKILIAPDSFKGSLAAPEVARAMAEGVRDVFPNANVLLLPIADGGEGTMRALVEALDGRQEEVRAHDALMRPMMSCYGWLPDGTAVLEMASTGGLELIKADERRPLDATSYGLGEQMADALGKGCKRMLIGLGGSATTDAGEGMMQALRDRNAVQMAKNCTIEVLCDVRNPLYGPEGAAYVFAPQKGATPEEVEKLDLRLRAAAAGSPHPEWAERPGAGAAGGLGFALMTYIDAQLVPGIDSVLRYLRFDEKVGGADIVLTGEGKMDQQTLMNKAPLGVLRHAEQAGVPVCALAGRVEDREELQEAGFREVRCIHMPDIPVAQAMDPTYTAERIRFATAHLVADVV